MTDKSKPRSGKSNVDLDLGRILGPLGEALEDMLAQLKTGHTMTSDSDYLGQSENGQVRTQAGLRIRKGATAFNKGLQPKKPSARNKTPPSPKQTEKSGSRIMSLTYDLIEVSDGLMLTADMPGVAMDNLRVDGKGQTLTIYGEGPNHYHANIDVGAGFDLRGIKATLRNGVLDLRIPRSASREGIA